MQQAWHKPLINRLAICACTSLILQCTTLSKPKHKNLPTSEEILKTAPFSKSARPHYIVRKTNEKINIDGKLDEASWDKAEVINLSYPWRKSDIESREHTNVRMLWDEKFFYLSVRALDENVWSLNSQRQKDGEFVRDQNLSTDDCLQFAFALTDSAVVANYFGFEVNAIGAIADYKTTQQNKPGDLDYSFNIEGLIARASLIEPSTVNNKADLDNGWIVEVAIPFSSLYKQKTLQQNLVWQANIFRCGGGNTHGDFGIWATAPNQSVSLHHPESFGFLNFEK